MGYFPRIWLWANIQGKMLVFRKQHHHVFLVVVGTTLMLYAMHGRDLLGDTPTLI